MRSGLYPRPRNRVKANRGRADTEHDRPSTAPRSDVEDHLGDPAARRRLAEVEGVVGDGLDLVVEDVAVAVDRLAADLGAEAQAVVGRRGRRTACRGGAASRSGRSAR